MTFEGQGKSHPLPTLVERTSLSLQQKISMGNNMPAVHRSATRRKACEQCVKRKRRCDLSLPGCTRCSTRNVKCLYVDGDGSEPKSEIGGTAISSSGSAPMPATTKTEHSPLGSIDQLHAISGWLEKTWKSLSDMNPLDAPFHLLSFPVAPDHAYLNARQSKYLVAQFNYFVKSFVLNSETPFLHPSVYRENWPDIYQDALGVCSLYLQRTPHNQDVVFYTLDCKVTALVQGSAILLSSVEGSLLALQVLTLYQIIRLFDGNPRQRGNAERHLQLMDTWTLRLHQNYSRALESSDIAPQYKKWILAENIRRTTMVAVVLRSVYWTMKDEYCELIPLLCTLPVSRSCQLWKTTEMNWREQTSSQEVLTYTEFILEWNAGNISGLDEFGKMLLVLCRYSKETEDFRPG